MSSDSSILEANTAYVSEVSFYKSYISGNSSVLASTPNAEVNHGCQHHDDSSGTRRIRRRDCHRVHYTSDLDDSTLTQYENKKRKRRATLLESLSFDDDEREELQLDTLENHLFTDMTFSKSQLSYDNSKFTASPYADLSWSKLQGVSYSSKYDFSNEDLGNLIHDIDSINHPKRSAFRQKRRLWYLNRKISSKKVSSYTQSFWQTYIYRYFHIIFFPLISMVYKISRKVNRRLFLLQHTNAYSGVTNRWIPGPLLPIYHFFLFIYNHMKTKMILVFSKFTSLSKYSYADSDNRYESYCFSCRGVICIFLWIILLSIFAGLFFVPMHYAPLLDPRESRISNAYPFYIDSEYSKIPIWHIHPSSINSSSFEMQSSNFHDESPVIMYLRKYGAVDTPQLKRIYQTLSSLGYHIIVPTAILTKSEIKSTWQWIKAKTNSTSILWGYEMGASTLTGYAKLFCKDLIPPTGVIISKVVESGNLPQSMEIWSCNCAMVTSGISEENDYKYNHVKCPITFSRQSDDDIYVQIVSCIEVVSRDIK